MSSGRIGAPGQGLSSGDIQQPREVVGLGALVIGCLEADSSNRRDGVQMLPGMLPIILAGVVPVGIAPAEPQPGDFLEVLGSTTAAHMAAERLAGSIPGARPPLVQRIVGCLVQAVAAKNWVAARKLIDLARSEANPHRDGCLAAVRGLNLKKLAAQYADHQEFALANDTLYIIEDAIRLGNRGAVDVLIVTADRNLDAVLAADRLLREGGAVIDPADRERLAGLCRAKLAVAEAQYA